MSNLHEASVINIIGHTTGAIIFAIFLILLLRDRSRSWTRGSWLSASAAALAFGWNAGSLAVILAIQNGSTASSLLVVATFCCLSLLPPVLLHLSLDGEMPVLTGIGYSLASVAAAMHCAAAVTGDNIYRANALLLITVGFVALTAISVGRVARRNDQRGKTSRIVASMCLLLFSMSFVHFGAGHPLRAWSTEAALHHSGIPLALFILMQDYRFVLLDAFIRFLVNVFLAAAITVAGLEAAVYFNLVGPMATPHGVFLVLGISALLVIFAFLRGVIQSWLTKAVFRRPDLEDLLQRIHTRADWVSEEEFTSWAACQIASFMKAERFAVIGGTPLGGTVDCLESVFPMVASEASELKGQTEYRWADALVPLRFSSGEVKYILLSRRKGGRRYLSEDFRALGRLATTLAEQVDRRRDSEMQKLVIQAELQALQSQINPHFLFNALNTLYGIIPRDAAGARRTVLNLADLFRYSLQSPGKLIRISEEMEIVRAYLDIEKLRLGERLQVEIDVDEFAGQARIPVLSIQPLVENAIKHGVSATGQPGFVRISAKRKSDEIDVSVENSGAGFRPEPNATATPGTGLGMPNVSRRLQLCYGAQAALVFRPGPALTSVGFSVPVGSVGLTTGAPV